MPLRRRRLLKLTAFALPIGVVACARGRGPALVRGRTSTAPSLTARSVTPAEATAVLPSETPTPAASSTAEPPAPTAAPAPPPPAGPPPPRRTGVAPPPVIAARTAAVVDGASGAVLFERDGARPLPPASTTKIMTGLLTIERDNLDAVVEVVLDGRSYWGSVMGLHTGDRFSVHDLLYGLLLPSGNDAAYALAVHLAGSEADFADMMSRRARDIGLTGTRFVNASGLGRDANLIPAIDLALLAREAMANPLFAAIVGTQAWTARGSRTIAMRNGNPALGVYPGCDGVKIGFGGRFGGNTAVISARRGGHRVLVSLLDTPDRLAESSALLDWAFSNHSWEAM